MRTPPVNATVSLVGTKKNWHVGVTCPYIEEGDTVKHALVALLCAVAPVAHRVSTTRLRVLVTAYCLSGRTASGTPVRRGTVAVDPAVIPMRSRLWIPGYGRGVALDTGSAVRGLHVDVWMRSCAAAMRATRYSTITVFHP